MKIISSKTKKNATMNWDESKMLNGIFFPNSNGNRQLFKFLSFYNHIISAIF